MYGILHADGSGETDPPLDQLSVLYDELDTADSEHGDVSLIDDRSGWGLSAHKGGMVVLEHLRDGGERHMRNVSKEEVLALWRKLAEGDIEGVLAQPWKPGYGSTPG